MRSTFPSKCTPSLELQDTREQQQLGGTYTNEPFPLLKSVWSTATGGLGTPVLLPNTML